MITRALPREEWHRLEGTELEGVRHLLRPDFAKVLVVEDEGHIVGCWALLAIWHVEGVWIEPAFRQRASVARRLLTTMKSWIRETGVSAVATSATTPEIRRLLEHLGAQSVPGSLYLWPTEQVETCQQP